MLIAVAGAPSPAPDVFARLHRQCAVLPARARGRTVEVPTGAAADVLTTLADLATEAAANGEPFAVCAADLLVSDTPLLQVLDDPRDNSLALVRETEQSDSPTQAVRIEGGRLIAAGSARHQVADPSGAFLGLLSLRPADLPAAVSAWRDAAAVIEDQGWSDLEPVQVALLALVRSGVTLTAVPVDPYLGERGPVTTDLLSRVESLDESDIAWRRASRGGDGVWSTFVLRRISRRLSRLSVRIGLTPNALTLISLVIAFGAAAMIAFGPLPAVIIGAILMQLSLIIDCSDGEVARSTRSFTPFGAWADLTSDRLKEYLALAAIAVCAGQSGEPAWLLALAGMGLQTVRHLQDYSFADTVLVWWRRPRPDLRPLTETAALANPAGPSDAVARLIDSANGPARWVKQALHAQIGERWLVLCAGLIIGGPVVALIAYLVLVAIAELWTLTGWFLRTVTRRDRSPLPEPVADLLARLRDDGILARVLAGRPRRPLSWLLPPLLTALEAVVLIGLTTAIAPSAQWLAYGWLAVVACRRYDLFYRHRTGRQPLPYLISALGGGWPLRIPILIIGALTGPTGFTWLLGVGTVWLALVVVPESFWSAIASLRPPARDYGDRPPLNGPARLRLAKSIIRRALSVPITRLLMALTPPRRHALVGGLPDTEENSLTTAVGLTRRYVGRVLLVANDLDRTRQQLQRVAALLGAPAAATKITVIPKAGWRTYWTFVTAELVCYTHGLYDSPRPGRRRIHVNLWHGTGPKWNANANFAQRIGAQAHSASSPLWGVEAIRALSMRPETPWSPATRART